MHDMQIIYQTQTLVQTERQCIWPFLVLSIHYSKKKKRKKKDDVSYAHQDGFDQKSTETITLWTIIIIYNQFPF